MLGIGIETCLLTAVKVIIICCLVCRNFSLAAVISEVERMFIKEYATAKFNCIKTYFPTCLP